MKLVLKRLFWYVGQKRRLISLALSATVILSTFSFSAPVHAVSGIEITTDSTEHTVLIHFEKGFRFVAIIKNNGTTTEIISATCGRNIPEDWYLLAPTGRYQLAPGQSINYVAVFEPNIKPWSKEEIVKVTILFSWNGGSKKLDITVNPKIFSLSDLRNESVRITVSVLVKSNNKPVLQAFIAAILPSGIES